MAKKKSPKNNKQTQTVVYSGEVTLKMVDKRGKVRKVVRHNSGSLALFTFITKALRGDSAPLFRPSTIMGFDESGAKVFMYAVPHNGTPLLYNGDTKVTGADASLNGSNSVMFTFMVPFQNVLSSAKSIKTIRLYNGLSSQDVCAECELASPEEIVAGNNMVLYWKMTFSEPTATK